MKIPTTPTSSATLGKSRPAPPRRAVPRADRYVAEPKVEPRGDSKDGAKELGKSGAGKDVDSVKGADAVKKGASKIAKKQLEGTSIAILAPDKGSDDPKRIVSVEDKVSTHRSEASARNAAQEYSEQNGGENVSVIKQSPDPDSTIKFIRNPTVYHVVTLDPGVDINHVDDLIDLLGDNYEIVSVGNEDGMSTSHRQGPGQRPPHGRPPTAPPNVPHPPIQLPSYPPKVPHPPVQLPSYPPKGPLPPIQRPPIQRPPIQILPMPFPIPADPPQIRPLLNDSRFI